MRVTSLILAIYMFIGGLIPRNDFSQLVHLVDLREHYLEHIAEAKVENETISFIEFLYIHFINTNQHNDSDNHQNEHQRLPFQTMSHTVDFMLVFAQLPVFSDETNSFSTISSYHCPFYLQGFSSTTIQPPRC